MEPSEPSPSPTVFDMPPRETEELPAPETDALRANADLSPEPSSPKGNDGEEPWFMRYQSAAPKQESEVAKEEQPTEAASPLQEPETSSPLHPYSPILTEEAASPQTVSDSLWHPPPPPEEYPLPGLVPSATLEEAPQPTQEAETRAEQPPPPAPAAPASVAAPAVSVVTGSVASASVPTPATHVPLKPAIGSVSAAHESPKPSSTQELRRGAAREDLQKAAQLGLAPRDNEGALPASRPANFRRSAHFGKLLALTFLANLAALGGVIWWLHKEYIEHLPVLVANPRPTPPSAPTPAAEAPKPNAPTPPVVSQDEVKKLEASLKSASEQSSTQVGEALKRLTDSEAQNQRLATRLNEVSATLATLQSALDEIKSKRAPREPAPASPGLPKSEDLTPTQEELVLLKERNRLTSYADEAIATAAREPYERLWETMDDPRLAGLAHAARAEILRVQNFYLSGSRIDRFDIPVATYFPEEAMLRDTQLKDDQLIKLLHDQKNPWEVRLKAANILGMRRSLPVGDALVKAILEEPNLDVMKEATFSFEQMTGYHAKLFDATSVAKWWKEYKATPPPPTPKPPKNPAATATKPAAPSAANKEESAKEKTDKKAASPKS